MPDPGKKRLSTFAPTDAELKALTRYRTIFEGASVGIVRVDPDGRTAEANPAMAQMIGYTTSELVGMNFRQYTHPDDIDHNVDLFRALMAGERDSFQLEKRCFRKDGRLIWTRVSVALERDENGQPAFAISMLEDVTEHKEAELRFRALIEQLPLVTYIGSLDPSLPKLYVSPQIEQLFGYPVEEWLHDPELLAKVVHPDDRARVLAGSWSARTESVAFRDEYRCVTATGQVVWVMDETYAARDERGEPCVQGYLLDITARKEGEKELLRLAELNRHQALYDQLTGLPNRSQLHQRIEQCLTTSRSNRTGFALLVIDLDRFKEINDSLGHHSGDDLLREVAGRLQGAVRTPDIVARLGGDEFGILMHGLTDAQSGWLRRVEGIKAALEQPVFVQDIPISVEASVGIAFYPTHGDSVELLLQRADVAMYIAKHENRGHATYNPQEDDNNSTKLSLLGRLRHAIDNNELILHYQPLLDLHAGTVTRVEALVRWQHPSHGLLLPAQFIPIAERTALIKPLTRYVLDAAVGQCKQWEREGRDLSVAVNLSTRNLSEPDLVEDVASTLAKWRLDPGKLLLEITESAIMSDPARTEGVLRTLSGLGIRLAVDDFGAGYTSLAYLARLPLDQVKIDRSFVAGILDDEHDRAIVQAIVHLCKDLGLQVVAEGVETAPTLDELTRLDCDVMQGYHLAKPLSPVALIHWLEQRRQPADKAA